MIWLIEEFNYCVVQKMGGYKTEGEIIVIETRSSKIKSSFTDRCLADG